MTGNRVVHCADAIAWLEAHPTLTGCSLAASLPDVSEFSALGLAGWQTWFVDTARLVLSRCPDDGVTVFYQSDIKVDGAWVDKAYLCQKAAESLGHAQLWHKIACRAPAGTVAFGRPAYSHMLAFSRNLRVTDRAAASADVLAATGEKTWTRGMGLDACLLIARFVRDSTATRTLVNPFCGQGSLLAAANFVGLDAVGIERSAKRAETARRQRIADHGRGWQT